MTEALKIIAHPRPQTTAVPAARMLLVQGFQFPGQVLELLLQFLYPFPRATQDLRLGVDNDLFFCATTSGSPRSTSTGTFG